jgi:hypothetical protein
MRAESSAAVAVALTFASTAIGITPWDVEMPYLIGVLIMLFHVGYAFCFQLHSERSVRSAEP